MKKNSLVFAFVFIIVIVLAFTIPKLDKLTHEPPNAQMQKDMANEALKHIDSHYLFSAEGQMANSTPFTWDEDECRTDEPKNCTNVRHFDCSGLVFYCANKVGFNLSWVGSNDQYHPSSHSLYYKHYVKKIQLSQLSKGSLVFKEKEGEIFHVGIYLGNESVVESTQDSDFNGVQIKSWDQWLSGSFEIRAGDLIPRT